MVISPFIPGESSRSAHLSPPLPGDQINILMNPACRRPNEEMNRRFVREEMHVREELGRRPPPDQTNKAQYYLVFLNQVGDRIYANDLVRAENGDPIQVAIWDTHTQSIISPDLSLSSAKVILIVLDGKFLENRGNIWSWSEFNQSVLSGRNGKGPILRGSSLTILLEDGVGTFRNIVFNDNSCWSDSKSIRLGVKVEEGYLNGQRVQEGVSKPFRVMDRKSKKTKKPKRLNLTHGVKCIRRVGKDSAFLLEKQNINTVEDFLKSYYNNESALCKKLCFKSESDIRWITMVEHATQCADEFCAKYKAFNNSSQPGQDLVNSMARNMSLSTHDAGRPVVGSVSSEPNPSENYRTEGTMPAINWQRYSMGDQGHTGNNVPFESFSSDGFGSPEIDPPSYFTLDDLDDNTPFPMEGCGVSGSGFSGPCSGGNDAG